MINVCINESPTIDDGLLFAVLQLMINFLFAGKDPLLMNFLIINGFCLMNMLFEREKQPLFHPQNCHNLRKQCIQVNDNQVRANFCKCLIFHRIFNERHTKLTFRLILIVFLSFRDKQTSFIHSFIIIMISHLFVAVFCCCFNIFKNYPFTNHDVINCK